MEGSEEPTTLLLSVFVSYNLHVQCKYLNPGGGCGVGEGVIAKSLLQNTEKTPECIKETIRKHC